MIPMKMKLNGSQSQLVIIKKVFQASEIAPIAIQPDENDPNEKIFKILFRLNEHISGTTIFFESRLCCEDDLDRSYIKSRSIYIENLKKDENRFKSFKNIMKEFNLNVFYVGDFDYELDNGNYYTDGYKQIVEKSTGNLYYESIRIYIPRFMLISLSLYYQDLTDPYNVTEREYLFASTDIQNMRFDKVENVKLLGTYKSKKDQYYFSYNTAYEFNNGPTSWKFTYEILTEEDLKVKEPINEEEFNSWYSKYEGNFIGTANEPNGLYVFTVVKNDDGKVMALMTRGDLINNTNLLDPYKIFIEDNIDEEDEEENDDTIIENINIDDANEWDKIDESTNNEEV